MSVAGRHYHCVLSHFPPEMVRLMCYVLWSGFLRFVWLGGWFWAYSVCSIQTKIHDSLMIYVDSQLKCSTW